MTDQHVTPTSSLKAGLTGRCPRCGRGALFRGAFTLDLRPSCEDCGLDYRFIDSGDGPAIFAIFVLGATVLGLALFVEFRFAPPFWVHVLLWGPVTLAMAFGMLRPLKGLLIAEQYKHKAGQSGVSNDGADGPPGSADPSHGSQ